MDASHVYVRDLALGCFHSLISTQTFRRALTASLDSLRGGKEYPFSDVTKSCRVWRTVPENGARSVCIPSILQEGSFRNVIAVNIYSGAPLQRTPSILRDTRKSSALQSELETFYWLLDRWEATVMREKIDGYFPGPCCYRCLHDNVHRRLSGGASVCLMLLVVVMVAVVMEWVGGGGCAAGAAVSYLQFLLFLFFRV